MNLDIIIEPIVTEKTNQMRKERKYVFKVDSKSNKIEIRDAIKQLFSVNPTKCNIINVTGKPKRVRYRLGRTSSWKKAIITLPPGEKIDIFEGA